MERWEITKKTEHIETVTATAVEITQTPSAFSPPLFRNSVMNITVLMEKVYQTLKLVYMANPKEVQIKIIGINGSPRPKGNTAQLFDEALQHAWQNGAETTRYDHKRLDIKGCQSCYQCKEPGKEGACVIKDDMYQIIDDILSADGVVFASPVYMWQMSAQAKLFSYRIFLQASPAKGDL
ncbi:flavodoxin family protein [Desulfopila sp. IMCC35008]|uniref:flavodoxin family protein n=1 Tax=Desulfopila sp. IMCC35008 TaxID=2653858 RepID=UPI0013D1E919|nr:flavodoxin family protein [Desulfopila sp. IMCC35008]